MEEELEQLGPTLCVDEVEVDVQLRFLPAVSRAAVSCDHLIFIANQDMDQYPILTHIWILSIVCMIVSCIVHHKQSPTCIKSIIMQIFQPPEVCGLLGLCVDSHDQKNHL